LGLIVLFVVYQGAWFAVVASAAHDRVWAGPALVAVLLIACSFWLPREVRGRWFAALLLLGLAGGIADSLVAASGLVRYSAGFRPWMAPPWIVSLWCLSALWLPNLEGFSRRPVAAALLGGLGAPLAYAGGVRLGAAAFPEPIWPSLAAIGAVWAVALPLMLRMPALTKPAAPAGEAST
jgi:hypothetical protein